MDKYLVELSQIADEVEKLCGLQLVSDAGIPVQELDMDDVVVFCDKNSAQLPQQAMNDLNVNVGRQVVKISYICARLRYYGKKKLDFSDIPCMSDVAKILLGFTEKKNLREQSLVGLNKLVLVLSEVDRKDRVLKNALSYRYLRIFLVLMVYGCNCNAGVIANFIIEQLIVEA